ncbi:MAG: hypothetical protein IJ809_04360 [Clostridia bacterium]|nr:hypothetical protein [Clostridia bacterium]
MQFAGVRPIITVYKSDIEPINKIGQIVTCGNEEFYVLNDLGETMELFAKTALNLEATAQVNESYTTTACAFSSSQYWDETVENINNVAGYTSTDVMGKVDTYATTKGAISGRLLTYDEANSLKDSYPDMIWGYGNTAQRYNNHGYEEYWLSTISTSNKESLMVCRGRSFQFETYRYGVSSNFSVRPVITVYKSQVST